MLIGCWAHSSAASMTILASCVFIGTIRIGAGWRSSARLVRNRSNGQFAVLAGTAPCLKRGEPRPGRTTGSASIGYRVGRLRVPTPPNHGGGSERGTPVEATNRCVSLRAAYATCNFHHVQLTPSALRRRRSYTKEPVRVRR